MLPATIRADYVDTSMHFGSSLVLSRLLGELPDNVVECDSMKEPYGLEEPI